MTDTTRITDARRFEGGNRHSSRSIFGAHAALLIAAAAMFATAHDSPAGQPPYVVTDIPAPPGAISGVPTAINEHGHVVGWANYWQSPVLRAWRWSPQEGTILLPQPPGATLYRAVDINDAGRIICSAVDTEVGGSRITLLTPAVDSIPVDLNGDGVVDGADLLVLLSNWGDTCWEAQCSTRRHDAGCQQDCSLRGIFDELDASNRTLGRTRRGRVHCCVPSAIAWVERNETSNSRAIAISRHDEPLVG